MKINSVYIIDDDSITIFGLRKLLSKHNAEMAIEEFKNGKMALDAIMDQINDNSALPDLIFLDINMPVMDGWAFLDEFLKLPSSSSVNITIISSSIDIRDQEKWLSYTHKAGHKIEFLTKPIYNLNLDSTTTDIELAS